MAAAQVKSLSNHRRPLWRDSEDRLCDSPDPYFLGGFQENRLDGMALIALDSRVLRVNRALCDMLGYKEEDLLECSVQHITHPDDYAEDLRERELILAGQQLHYQREQRFLHQSGEVLWAMQSCSAARDAEGRLLYFIVQVQDISERKRAEQALRDSEERFRSLIRLSADWLWEQDEELRFVRFSGDEDRGPWRPDQHDAIGKRRWELEGLQPLTMSWEDHRAMLEAHKPFRNFEYKRVLPGQKARYVTISGEPVFDATATFKGYRGTARDITEARLTEQRLSETQSLLHMAAQIGRLGAWSYDVGQPTMYWSEEVCTSHEVTAGYTPTLEEAINFYAPEYRDTMRTEIAACLGSGIRFDAEAQIVTARGRRIWMRVLGDAKWDDQGKVQRIHGACQDITDSKQAAEQTRLMADRLTTTLESLTDAFFVIDRKWRFVYINAAAEHLMRRPREAMLGHVMWDLFPKLRASKFQSHYEEAMRENVPVVFDEQYAPFDIWVQVKAYPSAQGLAVYIRDITELSRSQREISRLKEQLESRVAERTSQLEAANRALESFSYSVAHDLRAPLSAITGFADALEATERDGLSERGKHYLQRVQASADKMSQLIEGLLSLSRLARAELRCEEVDLARLAADAISCCRERQPARSVMVQMRPDLRVRGDPVLLTQLMSNLIGNAWKFTGKTARAVIEVGCERRARELTRYFVRDNGAGFDPTHATHLFEAFQRLHAAADYEGNGIGLAIVSKIVELHGGRIWAEAQPGKGATFFFTLGLP